MGTEFIFVVLYLLSVLLVVEISSLLFTFTGLEKQASRYQTISMLTGTGFTTDESQLIIDHPIRRRISAFSLAVMITILSIMLSNDLRLTELIVISSLLFLILLIGKIPSLQKKYKKFFSMKCIKTWISLNFRLKKGCIWKMEIL